MTATDTPINTRERQRRISDLWDRRADWPEEAVAAQVDEEMRLEALEGQQRQRESEQRAASYNQMTTCPACQVGNTIGSRDGLCPECSQALWVIRAKRAAAQKVNGRTREALVEAWIDR